MYAGIAGALLVFTGIWHATEWMMDGPRRDTGALVPVGLFYLLLGVLLVLSVGGVLTQAVALVAVVGFGIMAVLGLGRFEIRRWVTWVFIAIDAVVALALGMALIG